MARILLLPAREHPRQLGQVGAEERETFQDGLQPLVAAGAVAAEPEARQLEVLAHGERREDAPALRYVHKAEAHPRRRRDLTEIPAPEAQLARPWPHQPREGLQHGALAGTVGAQERNDLAFVDAQADVGHPPDGAVVDGHVGDLEDAHRCRRPR